MALVCRKNKLLYIQVPATGCSVVSEILRNHYGAEELGRKHNDVPELRRLDLISAEELEEYTVVANIRNPFDRIYTYYSRYTGSWLEYYVGVRLRDIDRKSSYLMKKELEILKANFAKETEIKLLRQKIMRTLSFNLWFFLYFFRLFIITFSTRKEERYRRLGAHVFPMLSGVNIVMCQEQLGDAFSTLQRTFLGNGKPIQLPVKNRTTNKRRYTTCYNWFTKMISCYTFKDHLKQYGYTFSSLSPQSPPLIEIDKSLKCGK